MNLFHQLIHKELTPISKFQSNPAYFFLHTFLSGFLEDCHFIKTKFNLLNLVLSNPFITKEHKEQIKESIKNLTYKKLSTFNRLDDMLDEPLLDILNRKNLKEIEIKLIV